MQKGLYTFSLGVDYKASVQAVFTDVVARPIEYTDDREGENVFESMERVLEIISGLGWPDKACGSACAC